MDPYLTLEEAALLEGYGREIARRARELTALREKAARIRAAAKSRRWRAQRRSAR